MLIPLAALLVATATPKHLVYTYTIGAAMHGASQFSPARAAFDKSGASVNGVSMTPTYDANGAGGTIVLDVVQPLAPDGSAVFNVTVGNFNGGKPFMCAAYGESGDVVCDANDPVPTQALLLLRVAGPNFYVKNRLDANNHWHVASSGGALTETSDFTVAKANGPLVTIAMQRHGEQRRPVQAQSDVTGTVSYDSAAQVATGVHATMTFTTKDASGADIGTSSRIDIELAP